MSVSVLVEVTVHSPPRIAVIIPAFNEVASLPLVLSDIDRVLVERIIVVDNNSTDRTSAVAREAGTTVVLEPRRGYGYACLRGIEALRADPPAIVAFMDADYSDHPEELAQVLEPILRGEADLVIGSRALGRREPGAMLPQALFGNWLATRLIRLFWGVTYTDLGPFRAVTWPALMALKMQDTTFGWTVEMQVKAALLGLRIREVPARYRRRIGVSKITGTIRGTVLAGWKILGTIFYYRLRGFGSRQQ